MNLGELIRDNNFQVGVVSGLVVACICWFAKKLVQWINDNLWRLKIVNACRKTKIRQVYDNHEQCIKNMLEDGGNSSKLLYFGATGVTLTGVIGKLTPLLYKKYDDIRFLILDPASEKAITRAYELHKSGVYDTSSGFFHEIETTRTTCMALNVKHRAHNQESRFIVCIFDKVMYVRFGLKKEYESIVASEPEGIHAMKSEVWKVNEGSQLYKAFSQQFEDIWEKSRVWCPKEEKYIKPTISECI